MRIGCDIERVEARSRSFEETFFTGSELSLLDQVPASDRACLVTLIWSAKESTLKALRTGLKADTRRVQLTKYLTGKYPAWNSNSWHSFEIESEIESEVEDTHKLENTQGSCLFNGWWRELEGMVITVVADHPVDPPTTL